MKMKHFTAAISAFAALVMAPVGHADTVTLNPGFDLLVTLYGTYVTAPNGDYIPLQGRPLGTFDFGGSIGLQNVGNTDTIVQRLDGATLNAGQSFDTSIQLAALQLANPTLGLSVSLASGTGTMDITYTGNGKGTFTSDLVVNAILTGVGPNPIAVTEDFTSNGNWHYDPTVINGGFAIDGPIVEVDPSHGHHVVDPVPLPAAIFFVAPALAGVFGWSRRKNNAVTA